MVSQSDSDGSSPRVIFGIGERPGIHAQRESAETTAAGTNSQIPKGCKGKLGESLTSDLDRRMQGVLDRLCIALSAKWLPNPDTCVHGEIKGATLFVYDVDEDEAWATFTHEVVEFKLKGVTRVYRTMINSLIDGYEKLAYQEKEEFIEAIPNFMETLKKQKAKKTSVQRSE